MKKVCSDFGTAHNRTVNASTLPIHIISLKSPVLSSIFDKKINFFRLFREKLNVDSLLYQSLLSHKKN